MSLTNWLRKMFSRGESPGEVELGRNDLCWCGSGKKYKRCHLSKDAAKQREANYAAQFAARNRQAQGIVPGSGKKAAQRPPENQAAARR